MKDLEPYPDLMTTEQVADVTGVKQRIIQAMCKRGELPTRGGRVYLVPKSVLPEFFAPSASSDRLGA